VLNSILNPSLPLGEGLFDPQNENENQDATAEPEMPEGIKSMEKEAMIAAERGDINHAIQIFTKVIKECPGNGSCYNNRAQAYRLLGRTDSALVDLGTALRLSEGKGKVASNAFCQRGTLLRKDGQDEAAMDDFRSAAALGSGFAKSMLVELNPYAAMCNAMLRKVFTEMSASKE